MDYYKIGQKIRKLRNAKCISQERLAESAEISVTHMSHIETGNTKLSLPVLANIAKALDVRTDDLLFDDRHDTVNAYADKISSLLESCNAAQAKMLYAIMKASKQAMDASSPES